MHICNVVLMKLSSWSVSLAQRAKKVSICILSVTIEVYCCLWGSTDWPWGYSDGWKARSPGLWRGALFTDGMFILENCPCLGVCGGKLDLITLLCCALQGCDEQLTNALRHGPQARDRVEFVSWSLQLVLDTHLPWARLSLTEPEFEQSDVLLSIAESQIPTNLQA